MIELKNVSKTYKTGKTFVQALKSVNFSIRKSDFVLIRGPSGSGKSTLLNIFGLLDSPSEGEILLNGKTVSFEDFDKLATLRSKTISFIFHSFLSFFPIFFYFQKRSALSLSLPLSLSFLSFFFLSSFLFFFLHFFCFFPLPFHIL